LDQFAHGCHFLLAGRSAALNVLVDAQEFHSLSP
jgi:hypothetical protein